MLQSKAQIDQLFATIDQTENQIVLIAFLTDRTLIIQQLEMLGLEVVTMNPPAPGEIFIRGNYDQVRIAYTIGEDPYTIAQTICKTLSGIRSIPLYPNLNSKVIQQLNLQRAAKV